MDQRHGGVKKGGVGKGGLSLLDKHSFTIVFKKDIRKLYIYKKCARLSRALHSVLPAFGESDALKDKVLTICMSLIDTRTHIDTQALLHIVGDLVTLIEILELMARSGKLSEMNASVIVGEIETLIDEIGAYEGPRVSLDEMPSLAQIAKVETLPPRPLLPRRTLEQKFHTAVENKGQVRKELSYKTKAPLPVQSSASTGASMPSVSTGSRGEAILDILRTKGPSYIKDISTLFSDVSEKTIQRELASLVESGRIKKTGERRWTVYTLAD